MGRQNGKGLHKRDQKNTKNADHEIGNRAQNLTWRAGCEGQRGECGDCRQNADRDRGANSPDALSRQRVFILFSRFLLGEYAFSLVMMASSITVPIWAIVNIFQAKGAATGSKVLWTLLILILPVIGLIIWRFAG